MDREKLKVMIKDLKNVVNALECEIYSDEESYTLKLDYDEIVNQITDYTCCRNLENTFTIPYSIQMRANDNTQTEITKVRRHSAASGDRCNTALPLTAYRTFSCAFGFAPAERAIKP